MIIHRLEENRNERPPFQRLGRHIVHDPRSLKFPARKARKIQSVEHKATGLPLNQGNVGSCTANAAAAALNCEPYFPNPVNHVYDEADAKLFYHDETELHPADGVYPPQDPGGCGLWIAKVLKNRGLIDGYSHAFGIDHALRSLVLRPCIFGIDWWDSFDEPDPATGLVEIKSGARVAGGHEICAFKIDADKELVWFWQSWGPWGFRNTGQFCMAFDTLDRLLQNQGDCTQFKKSKIGPIASLRSAEPLRK